MKEHTTVNNNETVNSNEIITKNTTTINFIQFQNVEKIMMMTFGLTHHHFSDKEIIEQLKLEPHIHLGNDFIFRYCAKNGRLNIVEYLLTNGADVHAENDDAINLAALSHNLVMFEYLIRQGADIHIGLEKSKLYGFEDATNWLNIWISSGKFAEELDSKLAISSSKNEITNKKI